MTTKNESTEIVDYEAQLAAMAKAQSETEAPAEGQIRITGGILMYNDAPCANNTLSCIVVASTRANTYFPSVYDADNPSAPICYSYGQTEAEMVPHPEAAEPQHKDCATCPKNQWKSAPTGKGKACKNKRILGIIPADATSPGDAPFATLSLPVMSVKNWTNYISQVGAAYQRPSLGVYTDIKVVPDAKCQFKVTFADKGLVPKELLPALIKRQDETVDTLGPVYEVEDEAEENSKIA